MDLSCLLALIRQVTAYRELKGHLLASDGDEGRLLVPAAVRPYLIAALHGEVGVPVMVITAQAEDAKVLYEQLQAWCPSTAKLQLFPETDFLPDEFFAIEPGATMERLQTLSLLAQGNNGVNHLLVVTSALAAACRTISRSQFLSGCRNLEVGAKVDPLQLIRELQEVGYEMEGMVEVPGTVSRRGGIVDVFSPDSELPARIEFSGNQIESIRLFEPRTQRSSKLVNSVTITPARERPEGIGGDTVLDYLPEDALLVMDDLDETEAVLNKLESQAEEFQQPQGSPFPYIDWAGFVQRTGRVGRRASFCLWHRDGSDGDCTGALPFMPVPSYGGKLEAFSRGVKAMLSEGRRVVVVSQQANRLSEILEEHGVLAQPVSALEQIPPTGSVTLVQGTLPEGWSIKGVLTLITDNEIFGFVKQRRQLKKRPVRHHWFVSGLNPGDYVVHIEHGIAKFVGLTKMVNDGIEREYLALEYAAGDRLFVPTDQADRVSRYIGAGDKAPTLSRLGTQEWSRTKQRIKEAALEMARGLLDLYAAREVVHGFTYSSDTPWQQELESSFPYVETPDQLEAAQAVKGDMEQAKPMDRLVCGDVGYGKTEVAVRATFKAVMDNKQVAVLVPTTVLAQQHMATFRERLRAFPVRIGVLSRFCTEKEQSDTIKALAMGAVDVCIGTHRLLQKDVVFKDLGLVIIDEEQRFGVAHKEHFKRLRQEVDVITLSATPIPRTLHMALAGIRDMSTIETPPEERLPIKTYVGPYDDRIVREAILRELERKGQVFFVHNRVHSIAMVAVRLHLLVPEARISVAHGQMPEDELEKVMADFGSQKNNVLVTTTIIESGLDMPNVNTLIVDQAYRLGLTQLYQLRGRIGRGSNVAYAYFLFEREKQLTPQAKKRLGTIYKATELGAGFAIAMKDLEIRGAGNLLGAEQSGYIAAVGFSLYCRLLAEAVADLKERQGGKVEQEVAQASSPPMALPVTAYIPEEYIEAQSTRMDFYQRLAATRQAKEIDNVAKELSDRFGAMPLPMQNLLYVAEMRLLAGEAGVESISVEDRRILLHFKDAEKLKGLSLAGDYREAVRVGARQVKLDMRRLGDKWQDILNKILASMTSNA